MPVATDELVWTAQPRQSAFLHREEDEVMYGGAAGGGKTDALLAFSIRRRVRHPGSKGLFLRRTFADLSKAGSAIDRSKELLADVAKWDERQHRWTFPNGSIEEFGYMQYEADKYNYRGAQYDDVCWDELTQFTLSQYLYLHSRTRATVDGIIPLIRSGTNPGEVGHGWVKTRFIKGHVAEQPFLLPKEAGQSAQRTAVFIPARLNDNQILVKRDPGYWDRLMALPEDEKRALAYGDWDVFAGQYFSEWRGELHVVQPFTIPDHWRCWGGLDWGYAKPLSFGLYTQDPDTSRVYRARELYKAGMIDSEAIAQIKAVVAESRLDAIYADPSMWAKDSDNDTLSTAEKYLKSGLPLQPANNARINGWRRVHDMLATAKDGQDLFTDGKPGFQIFANCVEFIRTLPELVYDRNRPEDLDSDGEDHAADECRYALVARSSDIARKPTKPERAKSAWEGM